MKSGKRETMEGIELPNQESIWTLGEKENCMYLERLEANIIKQTDMNEIKKKKLPQNNKKVSRNQGLRQKSHQRNKYLCGYPCKIIQIIKMDKGETQKMDQRKLITMHKTIHLPIRLTKHSCRVGVESRSPSLEGVRSRLYVLWSVEFITRSLDRRIPTGPSIFWSCSVCLDLCEVPKTLWRISTWWEVC